MAATAACLHAFVPVISVSDSWVCKEHQFKLETGRAKKHNENLQADRENKTEASFFLKKVKRVKTHSIKAWGPEIEFSLQAMEDYQIRACALAL